MPVVIATNNTSGDIFINDMGINISPSDTINLTDIFDYFDLTESNDLKSYVSSGDIGINDGTTDLNTQDAIQHLSIESEYEDLLQDSSIGSTTMSEIPVVNASNNNTFQISQSWTGSTVNFPTTDFQNNTNVIEIDPSGDFITIKESGVYSIHFNANVRVNTQYMRYIYFRILKNGSDVISNETNQRLYYTEIQHYSETITRYFNGGDTISLQISTDSGVDSDCMYADITVKKDEGIKGDAGAPGGTTVTIQKDDNDITHNTDIINFEGNVIVVDNGNNKATVTIPDQINELTIINVYDSTGGININTTTPTEYKWDAQLYRNVSIFDHTVPDSKIRILKTGWFKISYLMNYDSTDTTRKNILCYCMLNGNTEIQSTTTYSYTRNNYDDGGTNSLPAVLVYLNAGDTIQLICERSGSSGTANTYRDQCWLQIELIKEVI